MIKGSLMLHLGPIWYHSEPSDVPYYQNLPRPISWFGLFLQQIDSKNYDEMGFLKQHHGGNCPKSSLQPLFYISKDYRKIIRKNLIGQAF